MPICTATFAPRAPRITCRRCNDNRYLLLRSKQLYCSISTTTALQPVTNQLGLDSTPGPNCFPEFQQEQQDASSLRAECRSGGCGPNTTTHSCIVQDCQQEQSIFCQADSYSGSGFSGQLQEQTSAQQFQIDTSIQQQGSRDCPAEQSPQNWKQQLQQQQVEQHYQQPEAYRHEAALLEYQKSISRSLRAENCTSVAQLVSIIDQHGQQMDGQSVTACFSAASRLAKQHQQHDSGSSSGSSKHHQHQLLLVLQQQLLPLLQDKLQQLDAAGLLLVLYSLAQLQYKDEVLILQLEQAITPVVHQLSPRLLSQLLWSLGQLNATPNFLLQQQLLRSSVRVMRQANGQDMAQLLQGMVQLRQQPPQLWLEACCARVAELCSMGQLAPQSLCLILHSLACLASRPMQQQQGVGLSHAEGPATWQVPMFVPHAIVQQLLEASQQMMLAATAAAGQQHTTQQHASLEYQQEQHQRQQPLKRRHCVQLAKQPSQLHEAVQQDPHQHQQLQECCTVRISTQHEQHQPRQQQRHGRHRHDPVLQLQQPQLVLHPINLNMLSHALHLLKVTPGPDWQAAYLAAAQAVMAGCDARNLPLLVAPLPRWRLQPGQAWLEEYLQDCEGCLLQMQPQGLAVLGHSLISLRVSLSQAWLQQYLAAAHQSQLAATPAGCSYLMHTLGCWKYSLQRAAHGQFAAAAGFDDVGDLDSDSNAVPNDDQQAAAAAAAATAGQEWQAAAAGLADATSAGAPAGAELSLAADALVQQCVSCFMQQGQAFTAEQLGMFCRGMALWGGRGSAALSRKLHKVAYALLTERDRSSGRMQRFTPSTLSNLLLALAVAAPAAATPQLMAKVWLVWGDNLLPRTNPAHAAALAWAVGRLGVQPPPRFLAGLFAQLGACGEEAQLQQLAVLLREAKLGSWKAQDKQVLPLLSYMLCKHIAVSTSLHGMVQQEQQQQQWQLMEHAEHSVAQCYDNRTDCGDGSQDSSSSSSSRLTAASWNHRLKGCLAATAAAAAWASMLSPQQRLVVTRMCQHYGPLLNNKQHQAVQAWTAVLVPGME